MSVLTVYEFLIIIPKSPEIKYKHIIILKQHPGLIGRDAFRKD